MDVDGDPATGCECERLPGADVPDVAFTDADCDGVDGDADAAVFVSPDGDDLWPGTRALPMRTLQAAIVAATARPVPARRCSRRRARTRGRSRSPRA